MFLLAIFFVFQISAGLLDFFSNVDKKTKCDYFGVSLDFGRFEFLEVSLTMIRRYSLLIAMRLLIARQICLSTLQWRETIAEEECILRDKEINNTEMG